MAAKVAHFCGKESLWRVAKSLLSTLWLSGVAAQVGQYCSTALSRHLEVSIEPVGALRTAPVLVPFCLKYWFLFYFIEFWRLSSLT